MIMNNSTSAADAMSQERLHQLASEVTGELSGHIIPFWEGMKDSAGGFYGLLDFDLTLHANAEKGCILNSRIMWFFSEAYMFLKEPQLLEYAAWAFRFMTEHCFDQTYGGVFWSVNADGSICDSTKHTYNQAFAIYALSSFYKATKDERALDRAFDLFTLIETHCRDNVGYLESFARDFTPEPNDKLSENGVMAEKTMNTLLHVLEAYTNLYKVTQNSSVRDRLYFILDQFADSVWNPELNHQNVFFDRTMHPLIDLYSYGHDIEASWLIDATLDALGDPECRRKLEPVTAAMAEQVLQHGYRNNSVITECDRGKENTMRVWWVQAESMNGFMNAYEKNGNLQYLQTVYDIWGYIKKYMIDSRHHSEWFWDVDENGNPADRKPIVEPWKCPYHNGRMCIEIIKRIRKISS